MSPRQTSVLLEILAMSTFSFHLRSVDLLKQFFLIFIFLLQVAHFDTLSTVQFTINLSFLYAYQYHGNQT